MNLKILVLGLVLGVVIGSLGIYAVTSHPEEMTRLREELANLEDKTASLNELLDEKEDELESLYNQVSQLEAKNSELEHLIQNMSSVGEEVAGVEVLFLEDSKASLEYERWLRKANESIWVLVTSISEDDLGDALISASQRGIDVRVLVDESYDHLTAPREVFNKILFWGVDVRPSEYYGKINHRAMVVDREIVIAGSYGWDSDYPSNLRNSVFILRGRAFAQIFMEEFDDIWRRTTSLLPQPLEPWPELENGTIIISELEPNPPGSDVDNEWIELYNPWNFTIDISGYKLYFRTLDTNLTLTSGTHISPHQYLVISLLGELLDNEHDFVILYNADGDRIDLSPWYLDTEDDDITYQRVGKQSWNVTYHTKGRPNR